MHTHTCKHACQHTYTHTNTHTYTKHACTHICTCYMHAYTYTCMHYSCHMHTSKCPQSKPQPPFDVIHWTSKQPCMTSGSIQPICLEHKQTAPGASDRQLIWAISSIFIILCVANTGLMAQAPCVQGVYKVCTLWWYVRCGTQCSGVYARSLKEL